MTRAPRRHPAVAAAADLQGWVARWPGAPLPAVQVVSAWLGRIAAAPALVRPARIARAPEAATERPDKAETAHRARKAPKPAPVTEVEIAAERAGDRTN
jgi:hypothetical protein